jgi:hypothetical protein
MADVSLVMLTGEAGGVLGNVNRWLSQIGQPPLSEEQLQQKIQHLKTPLGDVLLVDLEGLPQGANPSEDGRIIAGIAPGNGGTLFFKMRGNAALTESQKAPFIQWIKTVRIKDTQAAPSTSPSGVVAENLTGPKASSQTPIGWKTPQDWKPVAPGRMRYAEFSINGPSGTAGNVSVSVFAGDGGGDLQNVNRWRAQIGLPPLAEGGLEPLLTTVDARDGRILAVDMTGPKGRLLAGWTRIDGNSWFFKLTAPTELAGAQKPAFMKFLQSVTFHP